jgi:L-lactate dehydrogenase complex protein LldG
MSARESILRAVRAAQPAALPLPPRDELHGLSASTVHPVERFRAILQAAGATVVDTPRSALPDLVSALATVGATVLSTLPQVPSTVSPDPDARTLAQLQLFVAEARLGVAENGAVWLPGSALANRPALFLAEHVAVALERGAIVADLHAAYARLDVRSEPFATFVAGPSKTADIEQSLVIGAHGPKRVTLFLIEPEVPSD